MKIETWPKTLYARTRHWNPNGKLGLFMGAQNTELHLTRNEKQETVEYIRADVAPKSFTQEEMQRMLECLKMGLAATMYVHGMESKSKDFVKEVYFERQEKLESAIKILKGHLHG